MIYQWFEWSDGFIICYNVTNEKSFEFLFKIKKDLEKIKKTTNIPIVVVGTHGKKLNIN